MQSRQRAIRSRLAALPPALAIALYWQIAAVAAPPATQPDQVRIARIADACADVRRQQWSDPIVERFDQPGCEKSWTFTNSQGEVKDGRLVVAGAKGFQMERPLPKDLLDATNVRIDFWIELSNSDNKLQRVGLFLNTTQAPEKAQGLVTIQPESYVLYEFAHGETGKLQQFLHGYADFVMKLEPMPWGKLVHCSLSVIGGELRGQRDGCPPLTWNAGAKMKLAADSRVGFKGTCGQLRVAQMSYRTPVSSMSRADLDKAARKAGFADAGELDQFMLSRVIPNLAHRSYKVREQTMELLRQLQPLSGPAIKLGLTSSVPDGEVAQRLRRVSELPLPVTVDLCKLDETPPGTWKPPASQPEAR
ncbi:MAG: hypothetical protein PHU85_07315 [Phycisphaerae bacterium]|nr:hypothetical protein [Phycisphaerae bacterium]